MILTCIVFVFYPADFRAVNRGWVAFGQQVARGGIIEDLSNSGVVLLH